MRWWEHYQTKTWQLKRRTVEGFWCETHKKPHATKTIKIESANG